jgi:septum formation protein
LDIILASTSEIRKTILSKAGIRFTARDAGLDEKSAKSTMKECSAREVAIRLAAMKSQLTSQKAPHAVVVGADQTLGFKGKVFDKPNSLAETRQQLMALRNNTHSLYSALTCSIAGEPVWGFCDEAKLTMRNFSDAFLSQYLAQVSATYSTSVGGYKVEETGINLFDKIEGDYFTVLGLPLLPLLGFFRQRQIMPS